MGKIHHNVWNHYGYGCDVAPGRFYSLSGPACRPANRATMSRVTLQIYTDCIQHNTILNCIQTKPSSLHQFNIYYIAFKAFNISGRKCNGFNFQLITNNMPQHAPSEPDNLNITLSLVAIEVEEQCWS